MALFRGIQEYIALDANNITLVFDSGNIVNISGNIFLYPPQGHPIFLFHTTNINEYNLYKILLLSNYTWLIKVYISGLQLHFSFKTSYILLESTSMCFNNVKIIKHDDKIFDLNYIYNI